MPRSVDLLHAEHVQLLADDGRCDTGASFVPRVGRIADVVRPDRQLHRTLGRVHRRGRPFTLLVQGAIDHAHPDVVGRAGIEPGDDERLGTLRVLLDDGDDLVAEEVVLAGDLNAVRERLRDLFPRDLEPVRRACNTPHRGRCREITGPLRAGPLIRNGVQAERQHAAEQGCDDAMATEFHRVSVGTLSNLCRGNFQNRACAAASGRAASPWRP